MVIPLIILASIGGMYFYIKTDENKLKSDSDDKIETKKNSIRKASAYIKDTESKNEVISEEENYKIKKLKEEIEEQQLIIDQYNKEIDNTYYNKYYQIKNIPFAFSASGIFIGLMFGGPIALIITLIGNHQFKKGMYVKDLEILYYATIIMTIICFVIFLYTLSFFGEIIDNISKF